jgi:hypothetical protein
MRVGRTPKEDTRILTRERALAAFAFLAAVLIAAPPAVTRQQELALGAGRDVGPGVALFHLTDPALIDPPGPLSIWLLRIDPSKADLRPALANDEVLDTETVAATAARHQAMAAVNAGFFFPNGDPNGIFKFNGQLVSETSRRRGAVGLARQDGRLRLLIDRVTAGVTLVVDRRKRASLRVPIAGVDTTRRLGKLMLFTPAYHAHTDTAPGGMEWVVDGIPLRVVSGPHSNGKTPIPRTGFVLSSGGRTAPVGLRALQAGTPVRIDTHYTPETTSPADWQSASDIVGGAGLLARRGTYVDDWSAEDFAKGFADARHPRTMIGSTGDGTIWLVTVDGRQPQLSSGMTLVEVRDLARRLELVDALNLDGGGSTTMWVKGEVVNSPSDIAGPRKVSDALLVFERGVHPTSAPSTP